MGIYKGTIDRRKGHDVKSRAFGWAFTDHFERTSAEDNDTKQKTAETAVDDELGWNLMHQPPRTQQRLLS